MKKIISLIAVVAIIFSFSVTAFAATASVVLENGELTVLEGTQDVSMDVTVTLSEDTAVTIVALDLVLPEGVTMKSYDDSNVKAICESVEILAEGSYITFMEPTVEVGMNFVDKKLTIPFVFTVDTTSEKDYEITFGENTMVVDLTGEPINEAPGAATITVKAADPVTPDPVEGTLAACANTWAPTNDDYAGTYLNVAVATATCPATATEAGFKFAKTEAGPTETAAKFVVPFDAEAANGEGNVEYTAIMYGVPYDEAFTTVYALPYYIPAN